MHISKLLIFTRVLTSRCSGYNPIFTESLKYLKNDKKSWEQTLAH